VETIAECSLPEKILLAAYNLENTGLTPFSAEALIVAAWQRYPRAFGLKGYVEQYPDSNKVLATLMGGRGLAKRGWLAKMGAKLYALTREGRQQVRRLSPGDDLPPEAPEAMQLPLELDKLMQVLITSSALQKYQGDHKQDLNFADACRFWNITEHLTGKDLDERIDIVRNGLLELDRVLGDNSALLGNGRLLTANDATDLSHLDNHLFQRFERHLTLLRNRVARN
jgi:hypothetical protein